MTLPLQVCWMWSSVLFSLASTVGFRVRVLLPPRSTVRTATFKHSGAFAWKVFVTSRNERFASKVCTLPKAAVGICWRNSSAVCGLLEHAATSATMANAMLRILLAPFCPHLMRAGGAAQTTRSRREELDLSGL